MTKVKHDRQIGPLPDRPVTLLGVRELVPVTRLTSATELAVINGVLTTVRVLQAA